MAIWYLFSHFEMLYQEKSGNPVAKEGEEEDQKGKIVWSVKMCFFPKLQVECLLLSQGTAKR
jgi:hypothetical protein